MKASILKYYSVSAVTGEGIDALIRDLYDLVKQAKKDEQAELDAALEVNDEVEEEH